MAKRVLIVEYAQQQRELLAVILGTHGFRVDTAADAEEARAMIRARHPDLMIVDARLPGINGWDLCEQVKHAEDGGGIPVLVLTQSSVEEPRFAASCADDMLPAPYEDHALLRKVQHLLAA